MLGSIISHDNMWLDFSFYLFFMGGGKSPAAMQFIIDSNE